MKKIILSLTILLTLAGMLLVPASAVFAANPPNWILTNDNNQVISYVGDGWVHSTGSTGSISEDIHITDDSTGDYAELHFYGVAVELVAATAPGFGEIEIYIDTVLTDTVDLYSEGYVMQQTVWGKYDLTQTNHVIKLAYTGTKNESSYGTAVNIDAIKYDDRAGGAQSDNPLAITCVTNATWTCVQENPGLIQVSASGATDPNHNGPPFNVANTGMVYGRVLSFSMAWHTGNFHTWAWAGVVFDVNPYAGNPEVQWQPCPDTGPYISGTCTLPEDNGLINQDAVSAGTMTAKLFYNANDFQFNVDTFSAILEFSTYPFETCGDGYMSLNSGGPFVIDPTIAAPLGQTGSPPDEMIYPVVAGYKYAIRAGGSPWHNATTADQDAISYSWDGSTWNALKDSTCVFQGPPPYLYTAYVSAPAGVSNIYLRAGDEGGNFTDNYMDAGEQFTYVISLSILIGLPECQNQFTYDPEADLIVSTLVPADTPSTLATDQLIPSDWYVIEVASGAWQDEGLPPDKYDAQFSWGNVMTGGPDGAIWNNIAEGGTGVFCATASGDYATVYTQADNSAFLYLRVNDVANTFDANTGDLTINVYHATFTQRTAPCELMFKQQGFVGHSEIPATAEEGITIGIAASINDAALMGTMRMVPGAWYEIETTDGPWGWVGGTHSDLSYDIAIEWAGTWVPLADWAVAACNVQIDALGHRRVYFQAPSTGTAASYTFRVNDTDVWFNNVGKMGIDMYTLYTPAGRDDIAHTTPGDCDYIYDADHPVNGPAAITFAGIDSDGVYIGNILTAGTIYAFVIEGNDYSWAEHSGGDPLYAVQISDDNGLTWSDVPTGYGPVLCYIENGHQTTIFVQAGAQYLYRFRVDSNTFADNTGSMGVNIYPVSPGDTINPWDSCTDGLALHVMDPHEWINEKDENGNNIIINDAYSTDQKVLGFVVQIEYGTGPWNDGETEIQHYDAQLSADNGTTWYPFDKTNPNLICAKLDHLNRYATAYFQMQAGQKWKIRVNDIATATFTDNNPNMFDPNWQSLGYVLYSVTEINHTPDCLVETNAENCIPPGVMFTVNGVDVCGMNAIAPTPPTSLIDVPQWLNYVSGWIGYGMDVFLQYLAWCPRHTDALMGLLALFKNRDPISTLIEIESVLTKVNTELKAYNWNDTDVEPTLLTTGQSEGSTSDSIINRLLGTGTNPWAGGPLITRSIWGGNSHYDACVSSYSDLLGNAALTTGVCFVSSAATEVGASFILQLLLELAALGFFLHDIIGQVRGLADFMAGGSNQGSE